MSWSSTSATPRRSDRSGSPFTWWPANSGGRSTTRAPDVHNGETNTTRTGNNAPAFFRRPEPHERNSMDTGDTAWMLIATALVLFMTPGLAFFYGGMVRSKNVLGMLMQNFFAMGLIAVLWAVVGFTLVFGDWGGFIGNFDYVGLADMGGKADPVLPGLDFLTIPVLVFCV